MIAQNLLYDILQTIHIVSIVVWIGGMYFVHFFLRPALLALEPPQRLALMHDTLSRFFAAVLVASLATVGSGIWMIGRTAKMVSQSGGHFMMPWTWLVMATLGLLMLLIFFYIRFILFKPFESSVQSSHWKDAGLHLSRIRLWVTANMLIGTAIIVIQTLFA